jgi:predicted esterase
VPAASWPADGSDRSVLSDGKRANVKAETGVLLTLHNWGGSGAMGTADPAVLADRYNVVAVTVDYLQSGAKNPQEPYDFGYLQALDALRALHFVLHDLQSSGVQFDSRRIFAAGGSGGGNVALMCNKLAPRTFACVVDLSGMVKLSDDIAFNSPGGSSLNAGYSRDAKSPHFLSPDAKQVRFVGDPAHLQTMRKLKGECKIVVVHGVDDSSCPVEDTREMVRNMQAAGVDVEAHFIDESRVDGKVFSDAGHKLGDRTQILQHVADEYLLSKSSRAVRRHGKSDFELRDELVRYQTLHGEFVISYLEGFPVGRFESIRSK